MDEFSTSDIVINLLLAARWTLALTLVAFLGGGVVGLLILAARIDPRPWLARSANGYIGLFQGTPLLLQLFLVFFGLPLLGLQIEPWMAASFGLTFYASAYLAEIWRGGVEALPKGQWEAARALGLPRSACLRLVVLPQALRMTLPPAVGFLVQLVKATAVTSIIGYAELMRTANAINNATFEPFTVYGMVAAIYFALCFPLTAYARRLEAGGQHRFGR
ncbi:amino acid ABC transporter permease [Lichenifustis flavocetrariae]|uniref:Amino acid ABC transporter permease n=1 Tax=Lichenifustis flavocetrariae TaxID=2949735 RepID=A0AA41Z1B5_9HYPH|nr:amino acid ABC transporter permease [Lichenifustis flavocetrariae]MCW6511156.1 amino acid ABC transporter permease [Lichenifustis flavocetrariae]